MPNLYATPTELKAAAPDGIRSTTTGYDGILYRLGDTVSRYIDRYCRRKFFPQVDTRYFNGNGSDELWVPDLLEITSIEISTDNGYSYEALTASDYYATVAGDFNEPRSYTLLVINVNISGSESLWPSGQRSVKITGVWSYAENRDEAWDDAGVDVDADYTAGASTLQVADNSVSDRWGVASAFHNGRLLKVDSEIFECTGVSGTTDISVIGGRNGSTAADHQNGDDIYLWRPPEPVKQAATIQAIRQLERGFQGFGDARATPDLGQLFFIKNIDPEAAELLSAFRRTAVG